MVRIFLLKIERVSPLLLCGALLILTTHSAPRPKPRERSFAFAYTVAIKDIPSGTKEVDLWIPVPHNNPFQKITRMKVESPYPYEIQTAQFGNHVLHVRENNPKQSSFNIVLRFEATRLEHIQGNLGRINYSKDTEPRDPDMARWLAPDRLVPLDAKVRQWAREVVEAAGARTDLEKARAIYNHVIATVKYDKSGKGWGRGDIYYACDARRGNCSDFHAIFIGYCRAVGVPARFAIGFPLPQERGAGTVSGYHCWAEFYAQGIGWVPIDASEAAKDPSRREYFFGAHDENRIEFTRGRDIVLAPKQQSEPLNFFIYPYAEVDGQPYSAIERSFSYQDSPSVLTDGRDD